MKSVSRNEKQRAAIGVWKLTMCPIQVDGLVMVDMESYDGPRPMLMVNSDCRTFISDCSCHICHGRRANGNRKLVALFEDYNGLSPEEWDELKDHQYLLCPVEIAAFVFKTREWGKIQWSRLKLSALPPSLTPLTPLQETLHVRGFSEPDFQEEMIHGLVMDDRRKETIKALAKSFARRNKFGEELAQGMFTADFVRGKGSGLIFLLHGMPGVGKTCTAGMTVHR